MIRAMVAGGLLVFTVSGPVFAEENQKEALAWNLFRTPPSGALSQASPPNDRNGEVFRQTPTLSGRVQLSEQTLIPYVGAGFNGGYVTERERALGPSSAFPQQNILGESLGKGLMPNEFHMGIRIPF
ncbi:MAG: exported protein of unknown function [Nitrospira sp.]|jgi:hypothetical protein|nr:exported protein of unknown function [Nitrospira sp.]